MKRLFAIAVCVFGLASATPRIVASSADANDKEQTITTTAPTMTATPNGVELSAYDGTTHRFRIYSITGQMIKSADVTDNTIRINLPKGFYIVKCDSWSKQLVVR